MVQIPSVEVVPLVECLTHKLRDHGSNPLSGGCLTHKLRDHGSNPLSGVGSVGRVPDIIGSKN